MADGDLGVAVWYDDLSIRKKDSSTVNKLGSGNGLPSCLTLHAVFNQSIVYGKEIRRNFSGGGRRIKKSRFV